MQHHSRDPPICRCCICGEGGESLPKTTYREHQKLEALRQRRNATRFVFSDELKKVEAIRDTIRSLSLDNIDLEDFKFEQTDKPKSAGAPTPCLDCKYKGNAHFLHLLRLAQLSKRDLDHLHVDNFSSPTLLQEVLKARKECTDKLVELDDASQRAWKVAEAKAWLHETWLKEHEESQRSLENQGRPLRCLKCVLTRWMQRKTLVLMPQVFVTRASSWFWSCISCAGSTRNIRTLCCVFWQSWYTLF